MDKIAFVQMLKDTEPLGMVTRCLDSILPYVDGFYLTVTHNTNKPGKNAKELARQLKVYCLNKGYPEPEVSFFKWVKDFSEGRNFNWSQVPQDEYPWAFWLDADDILINGNKLRDVQKKAISVNAGAVFLNYIYQADVEEVEKGIKIKQVLIEHLRERLVRNDGSYKWVGPIHETLIEQRQTNKTDNQDMFVLHLSNHDRREGALDRNIEILENTLEKQGDRRDPRIIYYLGKAYFDKHTEESYDKATEYIEQYLHGSGTNVRSGWEEERAQAWQYLAEIARNRGQFNRAIQAIANALIEAPKFKQFYVDMALIYVYLQRWDKALHWARLYDQVPQPRTTLVQNPRDMEARLHEVMFNIGVNTDNIEMAHAAAQKLLELFPDSEEIVNREMSVRASKLDNDTVVKIVNVANYLRLVGQEDKIGDLVRAIPDTILHYPIIISLIRDNQKPRQWEDNEIAIVCGPGFEKWSPENLAKGIGGSEEAVIYNSRELAKLGWDVTVYADPPEEYVEEIEGHKVIYKSHYYFNPKDTFNILIGWRQIGFFDHDWKAKKQYLWLHDVQNPVEYTKERVARINKIFVLSEAHKKTLLNDMNKEYLTDDKFLLTGNGINVEQFLELDKKNVERNPHRCIWTSSYDRGLEHLLDLWPRVIEEVPDAELHIFYGWNLFDKVHSNNPERMAWKAKMVKKMDQKGITHHGRVGQGEILEETFKSGVWSYPTDFYEISCITAMKCQAGGAIPVVIDFAALQETVFAGKKISGDIYEDETKNEYLKALVDTLKHGSNRKEMMDDARERFGWSKIAQQWDEEFKDA